MTSEKIIRDGRVYQRIVYDEGHTEERACTPVLAWLPPTGDLATLGSPVALRAELQDFDGVRRIESRAVTLALGKRGATFAIVDGFLDIQVTANVEIALRVSPGDDVLFAPVRYEFGGRRSEWVRFPKITKAGNSVTIDPHQYDFEDRYRAAEEFYKANNQLTPAMRDSLLLSIAFALKIRGEE